MKRRYGFTLVELLVVIAIISILASIVVPNVGRYIARGRMSKAVSEVRGAELALTQVLADAEVNSFRNLINTSNADVKTALSNIASAEKFYGQLFYVLLRSGRDILKPENEFPSEYLNVTAVKKLGQSYMDLGKDPWGQLYRFYAGPYRDPGGLAGTNIWNPYKIYRADDESSDSANRIPGGGPRYPKPSDLTAPWSPGELYADEEMGGGKIGYEAPKNLPVYIYSTGADMLSAQAIYEEPIGEFGYRQDLDPNARGGGDDINNWDKTSSWGPFYR